VSCRSARPLWLRFFFVRRRSEGAMSADTWRQLPLPEMICERMIGFSVPQDNTVLVVSYEDTHLIRLGSPVTVETDSEYAEYDLYDPDAGTCNYKGKRWSIIGLHPGRPHLTGRNGETLVLNTILEMVSVVKDGAEVWSCDYKNLSGD